MADDDLLIDPDALDAKADALDKAGESRHSTRAYKGDIKHYEHDFGGTFPATPDHIRRYIAQYSTTLSPRTMQRRLSSIAKFHRLQGYPDPVHNDRVRKTMTGLRNEYNRPAVQARPLTITLLAELVNRWDAIICDAATAEPDDRYARHRVLQALRAKAFFLLGFWCGLRADELVRLEVSLCTLNQDSERLSLRVFLSSSKGDRAAMGSEWHLPALPLYCPVAAFLDWINAAGISDGAVFRKIHRWANVLDDGLHINSVVAMMKEAMHDAGLEETELEGFSSHSLRRGFATEFTRHGGGLKELMAWVKWKSTDNALRYIDAAGDAPLSLMSEWLSAQGVELIPPTESAAPINKPLSPTKPAERIAPVDSDKSATVVPLFPPKPSKSTPALPFSRQLGSFDFEPLVDAAANAFEKMFEEEKTKKKLRARPKKEAKTLWRIYVELFDMRPVVWRRVDVDPTITFEELHDIIQAAMGWDNVHMWQFEPDYEGRLCNVVDIGHEFKYIYDFGDYWVHGIAIEEAVSAENGRQYPYCVEGATGCPREDSGGPGRRFKPRKFSLDEANQRLFDRDNEWE